MTPTILWFRQDFRLQDNPALHAAIARGGGIVPLYIRDDASEWGWPPGSASRWWRHHSLLALDASLRARGSRLVVRQGDAEAVLREVVSTTGAGALYWNRRYELAAVAHDSWLESALSSGQVDVKTFNGLLLNEPAAIANRQGRPFQVFGAYWRHCLHEPVAAPLKLPPGELAKPDRWPRSLEVAQLESVPRGPEMVGGEEPWQPGEASAMRRMREFVGGALPSYAKNRDVLAAPATSRLSPHLHFGEISPRQIWAAVRALGRSSGVFPPHRGAAVFLQELGWREFAYHLIFHFPHAQELPLRDEFTHFPWSEDPGGRKLHAWRTGRTGYPVVDAAMRQLSATGWVHNRARMIVASFLVKHLRLPWRVGAAWFWDKLVDADLANNTLGWQWSTGCGANAAPYFRIFAPVLQGRKFDPTGEYVRAWVPEIARLPAEHIHSPWEAPARVLAAAGIEPGVTYPWPIVDHATARKAALAAFREMRDPAARP
jgi:deoxyribodipyrimidine photo-lyase